MSSSLSKSLALPDGRILGYAEYGDPSGIPVFYFHGTPGSRLEAGVPGVNERLASHGLRCLAIDRPGIGLSTPRPKRRVVDWPEDVTAFADQLGIHRFAVLAVSGGAPYGLACGARIAERLLGLGLVAGLAPPLERFREHLAEAHRRVLRLARWLPWLLKGQVRKFGAGLAASGTRHLIESRPDLDPTDRGVLEDPEWAPALVESWTEAFRQGFEGPWWDLVLGARPWGFELDEVGTIVRLWFGGADRIVPPEMGQYLSRALPMSDARYFPREGHFSIVARRLDEVIARMATHLREAIAAGRNVPIA
ncbi:MAG: alpha/beta fold hydrolase [Gemmatimonadales bacterium]